MNLTLSQIAENPQLLTFDFQLKDHTNVKLRPLVPEDSVALSIFLIGLSPTTRKYYTLDSYDEATAHQLCADINKYDKLRFVAVIDGRIVALFEFSMDLVQADIDRYKSYGITLHAGTDCRFGPCVADSLQGSGFGTLVFPYINKIAKQLGQKRMILWGGVFAENTQAIRYYVKNGFREVGQFKNEDGVDSIDMIIEPW